MRNAMPIRWIEQAEERQVIAAALIEREPSPTWSGMARDAAAQWLPRLGSWLAALHPMGWAASQAQPALIGRPAHLPGSPSRDDDGYSCDW
jgi:hypothetical protein